MTDKEQKLEDEMRKGFADWRVEAAEQIPAFDAFRNRSAWKRSKAKWKRLSAAFATGAVVCALLWPKNRTEQEPKIGDASMSFGEEEPLAYLLEIPGEGAQ